MSYKGSWSRSLRALIRELFETVILALLIFLGLQFSVQTYRVEGSSMTPTLDEGQYLIVNKLVYFNIDPRDLTTLLPFVDIDRDEPPFFPFHRPHRGEIVIFRFPQDPSRDFVKRVIGVPGDKVEMRQGEVFVNDVRLDEPYITRRSSTSMEPLFVPSDSYFVLGDNRVLSNDSRTWGPVPADNIKGKAWVTYWPLDWF